MTQDSRIQVGEQIGNYRLVKLLGKGGFADVYLGEHTLLKTQVAIKFIRVRLAKGDLEGFLNEAQTVARLRHPHIVRVFEGNVEDDIPYLVMDYLPGGALRQHYPRGTQLPPTQVAFFIEQIADALHYAHQQRLIHRDVKPENILVDADGQLLLSDFGLVLIAESSSAQMVKGTAGTAPYMAPEQLQGRPRFASDQYALGIIAYEWLTGELPFNGSWLQVATQHVMTPPPPLRQKVPTLPEAVEQVVLKALAKEPAQRFANVVEFAQALTKACTDISYLPTGMLPLTDHASPEPPTQKVPSMDAISPAWSPGSTMPPTTSSKKAESGTPPLSNSNMSEEEPTAHIPLVKTEPPLKSFKARKKTSRLFVLLAILGIVGIVVGSTFWYQMNIGAKTPVPKGQISFLDNTPGKTDALKITIANLANPPDGSEYDAWLINNDTNEQILPLGSLSKSDFSLLYSSPSQTNLLGAGNQFEITQERGHVTRPTGKVLLTATLPFRGASMHIRHLMFQFTSTPGTIGLLVGLVNETKKVYALAQLIQNSATSSNTASIPCITQAMINVIEGNKGAHFQQLADDCANVIIGSAEVGDGFGILNHNTNDPNNKGYLATAIDHAQLAATHPDATETIQRYAKDVETSIDGIKVIMTNIDNDAVQLLSNPTTTTQVSEIVKLSDHAYYGVDQDGDREVDPVAGEAGALTAYASGQLMATVTLA